MQKKNLKGKTGLIRRRDYSNIYSRGLRANGHACMPAWRLPRGGTMRLWRMLSVHWSGAQTYASVVHA